MKYSNEQMREIYHGIRFGVDVAQYRNHELKPEQMKQLRLGLQQGVDISKYNKPYIDAKSMQELRKALASGVTTNVFDVHEGINYNAEQVKQIRLGLENGQNIELWANPEMSAEQMKEIRLGQRDSLNAELYASTDFTVEQMKKMRFEMAIQYIIEKIKETCAELWAKLTAWAERNLDCNISEQQMNSEEGLTADQIHQAEIKEKISQAFAEVFTSVEKLSQTVSTAVGTETEKENTDGTFDEMPLDEKLDAFKAEIDRQLGTAEAQQAEEAEEIE